MNTFRVKVTRMQRRPRGQVISNLVASGMGYAAAVREYDRLDRQDFIRRYAHIFDADPWFS